MPSSKRSRKAAGKESTTRPQLNVRVPAWVLEQVHAYLRSHKKLGWTQDQLVLNAILTFMAESSPDEILFRRLERLQAHQERTAERVEMIGHLFTEFLFYWFRRWPEATSETMTKRRAMAVEITAKYLSSLKKSIETSSAHRLDILDLKSIAKFLERNDASVSQEMGGAD